MDHLVIQLDKEFYQEQDGKRPGYYGSDAGFGSDDYKDESASFDSGSGSGGSDQDFADARAAMNARTVSPTRDEAIQNPFGITRVNKEILFLQKLQ